MRLQRACYQPQNSIFQASSLLDHNRYQKLIHTGLSGCCLRRWPTTRANTGRRSSRYVALRHFLVCAYSLITTKYSGREVEFEGVRGMHRKLCKSGWEAVGDAERDCWPAGRHAGPWLSRGEAWKARHRHALRLTLRFRESQIFFQRF